MKYNIYFKETSRLSNVTKFRDGKLLISYEGKWKNNPSVNQNLDIFITSDEKWEMDSAIIRKRDMEIYAGFMSANKGKYSKIVMTNDQEFNRCSKTLPITNDILEWICNNPESKEIPIEKVSINIINCGTSAPLLAIYCWQQLNFCQMDEFVKDQFRIDNDGATESTLYCYVNVNQQILVRVTEHCWDTGTEFFGESIEEHNDAGIQLTKENAIKLRDELDRLIKSHYCPTHNEVGLNREQCDSQGFCSRCDCSSLRIINNKTQF